MASKIVVNLDTSKEIFIPAKCKQNDDLILEANIFENGLSKDLANCSITIKALKADKTYIIQNTDIVKENNKITTGLVKDFTRVPGETKIEIVLIESSKQNTTFSFCLEVVGSVIRGAVESSNTVTILEELDNKIVEAGQVRDETEQLIATGGAATKGDIQEVNTSLEQIATINISQFPRLSTETDDAPRFQRAFNYLNGRKGKIKLNAERYYYKTRNEVGDAFVEVYPYIDLEGMGDETVIYIDNNTPNAISGIFKCLNMHDSKFENFTFDTTDVTLVDDNDFYDLFYFRYDSTKIKNFNVKISNVHTKGKAFQSTINIGVLNENEVTEFAKGLIIENCTIQQQGYATCLHDIVYKNVTWVVDLDILRPSYLNNATQTPVKFSGKKSFIYGSKLIDCKMLITGSRLSFNPIEFFRTSDALIENLNIITSKNGHIVVSSKAGSKVTQYGATDKETKVLIKNCNFSEISILTGELGYVKLENCSFENCNNTFYGNYTEDDKETSFNGYSKIIVINSIIKDTCSRIVVNGKGSNIFIFKDCVFEYDRSKSLNGGFGVSSNGELVVENSKVYINGTGGAYLLSSSGSNNIEFINTNILNGTFASDGTTMLYLSGNHYNVVFINTNNLVKRNDTNFLDKSSASITKEIIINSQ